jgi:tetratricopeptide (TPR) repeat protein
VAIPFVLDTDTKVMESIEQVMAGPSGRDYYVAAAYFYQEGKDMKQALKWVDKSLELDGDRFWVLRTKALIQKELGKYDAAIKTLNKSSEAAREWGNEGYPKMNDETIAEIKKMR